MYKMFHNLLVPLNLDKRTERSMEKAIEFANQLGCHVHFFFHLPTGIFSRSSKTRHDLERAKVYELKDLFQKKVGNRLKLYFQVRVDDIEEQVTSYTAENDIDLIWLDRPLKKNGIIDDELEAGQLAGFVDCPVLTTGNAADVRPFKTIVLPVESIIPVNKIRIAVCLAKQFHSSIHIAILEKQNAEMNEISCMQRVFELLKNNTDLDVACVSLRGKTLQQAALRYSQSINASLVTVNSETVTSSKGLLQRFLHLFSNKTDVVPLITVA